MYDLPLRSVMETTRLLTAPPTLRVSAAARAMAERRVGAVMVVDAGRLVGIFTERDAVFRVMARGLDADATPLADVMTAPAQALTPEKRFGVALALMHRHGFRHVPVVEDGRPVGIVSARNALDPELEDFVVESHRREHYARS